VRTGAPLYGEHTREILAEHGFSRDEIAALEHEGSVVAAAPAAAGEKVA
jgi:crotonobetainyl-CoA:carnitine CoA-transferase CaiB-like acyl-CoA transferase